MTTIAFNTHVHYQMTSKQLRQQAIDRGQAVVSDSGALVISTGKFTGRSPADKFIVQDSAYTALIDWNGFNHAISTTHFFRLLDAVTGYLDRRPEIWVREVAACADPRYRLPIKVVTEDPQSNHFAANMFMDTTDDHAGAPDKWQLIHAPGFLATPGIHGTRNPNFTVISFQHRMILVGGSAYTGEIKKAVFTVLNLLLPVHHGVLSMHCSASEGDEGVALFFGLSGTGKTTLSAAADRKLIGDDELGWDDHGVFNLEGGCYAKVHGLSPVKEPGIFEAIREGAVVENTVFYKNSVKVDYEDASVTENTRASYPLDHIAGSKCPATGPAPANIFFLTCDAYGVFPPIARLTQEQAVAYYLSGYTAKVSGTEHGITEPKAVFSACFGAPFLPLSPSLYASIFAEKLNKHRPRVWMVNTGWIGGAYGAGQRIALTYTRAMVAAALSGALNDVAYEHLAVLDLDIPASCPGIPESVLNPKKAWQDAAEYDAAAAELVRRFEHHAALNVPSAV
jgi:phosphoenolpyruvate carboxykinase (ATP)